MTPSISVESPGLITLGDNVLYALPLDGGGVLLIDAGPDFDDPEAEERLGRDTWTQAVAQASTHGIAPSEVRYVLVTHAHIDHAGLAHRWAAEGATIVAGSPDVPALRSGLESNEQQRVPQLEELRRHGAPHELVARYAVRRRRPAARRRVSMRWEPCPPDAIEGVLPVVPRTFDLEGGATLRALPSSGHTPGNLVGYVEATGDLYSGDTLLPKTIPTPGLHFPRGSGDRGPKVGRWPSLPSFLRSVAKLRALDVRRILPGHGSVVDDADRLFNRFNIHHERRSRRIRALLAERPDSAYGLVRRLFPHLPDDRVWQAMTEMIGHLDVLEEEFAALALEQIDDVPPIIRYRLNPARE